MKRNSALITLLALVLCMAILASGCASSSTKKIAAKVGDREVTVQQLENLYNNNSAYASYYYGYDITTDEGREGFIEYLLNGQIQNVLLAYEAEKADIQLSDEEKAEAKAAADKDYESFYQDYVDYATSQGASDVKAQANKLLTSALVANGMTIKKVKADFLANELDNSRVAKHKAQILEGVAPTEDDIKASYEEMLASQESAFAEAPSQYFTQEMYYSYGYSYMPLTVPEGFFYVRNILVEDEETANKVLERINAGEDFEALLKEYNTDPGMESNLEGYIIGEGANYVTEFLEAALALENEGDVSAAVKTDYGYHIIKRLGNVPAGPIDFETIKDTFTSLATEDFIAKYYSDKIEEWKAEEGLIEKFEEEYKNIGK